MTTARGLRSYQQLPSLRAVLIASHRARRVTLVHRAEKGWEETDFRGGETVMVSSPPLSFAVDELSDLIALVQ